MTDEQLCAEIRDANLGYLMLAQHLIRQNKAEALLQLGVSDESADRIAALSSAQILKIASSNMLLCRFRVDDDLMWSLLTNHSVHKVKSDVPASKLHASHSWDKRFADAT